MKSSGASSPLPLRVNDRRQGATVDFATGGGGRLTHGGHRAAHIYTQKRSDRRKTSGKQIPKRLLLVLALGRREILSCRGRSCTRGGGADASRCHNRRRQGGGRVSGTGTAASLHRKKTTRTCSLNRCLLEITARTLRIARRRSRQRASGCRSTSPPTADARSRRGSRARGRVARLCCYAGRHITSGGRCSARRCRGRHL